MCERLGCGGCGGIEGMTAEMAGPGAAQRVVSVAPQSGQAVTVGRGEQVRVVDPGGRQVGDMWTIDAADRGRWLSASHTRDPLRAPVPWAEPGVGQPCRPCAGRTQIIPFGRDTGGRAGDQIAAISAAPCALSSDLPVIQRDAVKRRSRCPSSAGRGVTGPEVAAGPMRPSTMRATSRPLAARSCLTWRAPYAVTRYLTVGLLWARRRL
jgi:hypothetical protein